MPNLSKCTRCGKVVIDEEYPGHHCMPKAKNLRKDKIAHYLVSKDRIGRSVLEVLTLGGNYYEFTVIPENKERTRTLC